MRILCAALWLFSSAAVLAAGQSGFYANANSKKPIEINADSLEVFQGESKALFKGNVIADQGQMHLKSDVMTVFYATKDDKAAKNAAGKANSIRRINVDGNVFMTAPEQSAKANSGYYDTQKNFLELVGNVVLTKDKNVLHGAKLDYDLNTGYSKMIPDGSVNNGRVRALFTPEDKDGPTH